MAWIKQFDEEQALQCAMEQFWAHGYEATSMQDLVDRMGINRGSLYHTFGDKRSLFIRAFQSYVQQYREQVLSKLEQHPSPRQAIHSLFQGLIDLSATEQGRRGCFMTNTALELAAHDPEIGALVKKRLQGLEAFFKQLIVRAQALGEIAKDHDPDALAAHLLGVQLGIRVLMRAWPEGRVLQGIVDAALASLDR